MEAGKSEVIRGRFTPASVKVLSGETAAKQLADDSWDIDLEETRRRVRQQRWKEQIHDDAVEREFHRRRYNGRALSPVETVGVVILTLCLLASCVFYLNGRAREHSLASEIQKKQTEYVKLLEDNNAFASNIEGKIDHAEILRYVTEECGMHYPHRNQVLEYGRSEEIRLLENGIIPVN